MENQYTPKEEKELNLEIKKWKNRAKRLILSDYYNGVHLSDLEYSILTQITNAESHRDINSYLWNTGMIERTLDRISDQIKQIRIDSYKKS